MPEDPLVTLGKFLTGETKINFSATVPLEAGLVAVLNSATSWRETMTPEIRERWDKIWIETAEEIHQARRRAWKAIGLLE